MTIQALPKAYAAELDINITKEFPKFRRAGHEEDDYSRIICYVHTILTLIREQRDALTATVEAFREQNSSLEQYRTLPKLKVNLDQQRELFNRTLASRVNFSTIASDMKILEDDINEFCDATLVKLDEDLTTLAAVKGDSKIAKRTTKRRTLFDIFRENMEHLRVGVKSCSSRVRAKLRDINVDGNKILWSITLYEGAAIGKINLALLHATTYTLKLIEKPTAPLEPPVPENSSSSDEEDGEKAAAVPTTVGLPVVPNPEGLASTKAEGGGGATTRARSPVASTADAGGTKKSSNLKFLDAVNNEPPKRLKETEPTKKGKGAQEHPPAKK